MNQSSQPRSQPPWWLPCKGTTTFSHSLIVHTGARNSLRSRDKVPGQGLARLLAWLCAALFMPLPLHCRSLPCGACRAHAAETLGESGTHKPRAHAYLREDVVKACTVSAAANAGCMSVW